MLSIVPTSLEVSSTSTSTSPRVQTTQPSLSLQMVLQMKFTIIRIVALLVLLKQCGISFNLPSTVALQLSIIFSYTSRGRTKCTLSQTRSFHMLYSRLQTRDPVGWILYCKCHLFCKFHGTLTHSFPGKQGISLCKGCSLPGFPFLLHLESKRDGVGSTEKGACYW